MCEKNGISGGEGGPFCEADFGKSGGEWGHRQNPFCGGGGGGEVWIFSQTTHCGLIIIIIILIITVIIAIIITIIIIVLRYLPVSTSLEAKRNH